LVFLVMDNLGLNTTLINLFMVKKIKLITILFFLFCSTGCERGWIWILLDNTFDIEISNRASSDYAAGIEIWKGKSKSGVKVQSLTLSPGELKVWEKVEGGDYFIKASFGTEFEEEIISPSNSCSIDLSYSSWGSSMSGNCFF